MTRENLLGSDVVEGQSLGAVRNAVGSAGGDLDAVGVRRSQSSQDEPADRALHCLGAGSFDAYLVGVRRKGNTAAVGEPRR